MEGDKETDERLRTMFSRAVDYDLIETDDGNFFFTIDDSIIPRCSGSKHDSITTMSEGRFDNHSLIEVNELSSTKEKPTKFVLVVCPFSMKNDSRFSRILNNLIATAEYGKKEIGITIIGRTALDVSQKKGHSIYEIFQNKSEFVPNNYTEIVTNLEILSATYKEVMEMVELGSEYSASLCPYCYREVEVKPNGNLTNKSSGEKKIQNQKRKVNEGRTVIKILRNFHLLNKIKMFPITIPTSEQFGKAELFVEFVSTPPFERDKAHMVAAKIFGSTKNGFLDLVIIDPDYQPHWFPDPKSYDSLHSNGNLNFENGTYEAKWEFSIPQKTGKYRAIMGLYENGTENRIVVNFEEFAFMVNGKNNSSHLPYT